jgi:HK97 family phage prohead protease
VLFKDISVGFKDLDVKQGVVTGYFAHFGSIDSDGDRIMPGAFSKTIKENGPEATQLIKHLLDHKRDNAIGKLQVLKEDSVGVYYESKAGRHTAGRDFLMMAEDGIINQHSFGYEVIKELKKADANDLLEIRMHEGSSIQFLGANRNTPVTGVKSESDILEDLTLLERALRNGKYSDAAFVQIEAKIKSLYAILKPDSTLGVNEPIKQIISFNHFRKFSYEN